MKQLLGGLYRPLQEATVGSQALQQLTWVAADLSVSLFMWTAAARLPLPSLHPEHGIRSSARKGT